MSKGSVTNRFYPREPPPPPPSGTPTHPHSLETSRTFFDIAEAPEALFILQFLVQSWFCTIVVSRNSIEWAIDRGRERDKRENRERVNNPGGVYQLCILHFLQPLRHNCSLTNRDSLVIYFVLPHIANIWSYYYQIIIFKIMLHLYVLDIIFSPVCGIYKRARALALHMLSYYTFDLYNGDMRGAKVRNHHDSWLII